jgi:hypothetical protein
LFLFFLAILEREIRRLVDQGLKDRREDRATLGIAAAPPSERRSKKS